MSLHNSPLYILIRSWNSFKYFDQCINSVLKQAYKDYTILFVDDCSEYTKEQKKYIKNKLKRHVVVFNKKRKYALRNAYEMLNTYVDNDQAVIFNLDGDDYLSGTQALYTVIDVYIKKNCLLTYGECYVLKKWSLSRIFPARFILHQHNTRYPPRVEKNNSYRDQLVFRPLHPRTWKMGIFRKIKKEDFLDENKDWFKTCEDQAMFFPMLEMNGGRYEVIKNPIYCNRRDHEIADYRLHKELQLREERLIRMKEPYKPVF